MINCFGSCIQTTTFTGIKPGNILYWRWGNRADLGLALWSSSTLPFCKYQGAIWALVCDALTLHGVQDGQLILLAAQSRRHGSEALGYMPMYFIHGRLPRRETGHQIPVGFGEEIVNQCVGALCRYTCRGDLCPRRR